MGLRKLAGATLFAATLLTAPAPAVAQTVTFSTSGSLSGSGCTPSLCDFGSFVLAFTPGASNGYAAPTFVNLGDFATQCSTCTAAQSVKSASGAMFTLTISQTDPTGGTNQFLGTVTGSLSHTPSSSSLAWTPLTLNAPIGLTNFPLVTDAGPTTDHNPNATLVNAFVTTVPEPASMALMAVGLVALLPVARRRRRD
jgi:hypothetical protein